MHIHILGICGTFMGGVAVIAKEMGHTVTGSDANVYPPMSTQLEQQGIQLFQGYEPEHLNPKPDLVIVGNVIARGNPAMEYLLESDIPYTSGPQWMSDNVLRYKTVIAVAGTHGKTTTSSMLAWMLEFLGEKPSFLIGGVPTNLGVSARLTDTKYFVIEADEYDTAFFDKRSKFVHYHPKTLIINNLEYDHADIFEDLASIQKQFHHAIRIVPSSGCIIYPDHSKNVEQVLNMGCWSKKMTLAAQQNTKLKANDSDWRAELIDQDGGRFNVLHHEKSLGMVAWKIFGDHNVANALAALAAISHQGLNVKKAIESLAFFENVKRRMEVRGIASTVTVYDDFAHHPTAIETTLEGLRKKVKQKKIIAIVDPRSNTMKNGVHKQLLPSALKQADSIIFHINNNVNWTLDDISDPFTQPVFAYDNVEEIIQACVQQCEKDAHVLVMSNGGFENIHQRLLDALKNNEALTISDFWHAKHNKPKANK